MDSIARLILDFREKEIKDCSEGGTVHVYDRGQSYHSKTVAWIFRFEELVPEWWQREMLIMLGFNYELGHQVTVLSEATTPRDVVVTYIEIVVDTG